MPNLLNFVVANLNLCAILVGPFSLRGNELAPQIQKRSDSMTALPKILTSNRGILQEAAIFKTLEVLREAWPKF